MIEKLHGKKILITSGPTREHIDPVRYLSNASSGKQGAAVAEAMVEYGADVTIVSGPVAITYPKGANLIMVETAEEMLDACISLLPVDVAICAAAVSDWRPRAMAIHKLKKQDDVEEMTLSLVKNPDILATLSQHAQRPPLVIGFAAETQNVTENAREKLVRKQCDWVLANDVSRYGHVFGAETNTVQLITKEAIDRWPTLPKKEIGRMLAQHILLFFRNNATAPV